MYVQSKQLGEGAEEYQTQGATKDVNYRRAVHQIGKCA